MPGGDLVRFADTGAAEIICAGMDACGGDDAARGSAAAALRALGAPGCSERSVSSILRAVFETRTEETLDTCMDVVRGYGCLPGVADYARAMGGHAAFASALRTFANSHTAVAACLECLACFESPAHVPLALEAAWTHAQSPCVQAAACAFLRLDGVIQCADVRSWAHAATTAARLHPGSAEAQREAALLIRALFLADPAALAATAALAELARIAARGPCEEVRVACYATLRDSLRRFGHVRRRIDPELLSAETAGVPGNPPSELLRREALAVLVFRGAGGGFADSVGVIVASA